MKYDLGWGNSICVRQAFLETAKDAPIILGSKELLEMNYPPHEGDLELIELTRKVIERQVGLTYKYILLTNGATGGVTLALRSYAKRGYNVALTRSAPFFPIYPSMIRSAGLKHRQDGDDRLTTDTPVALVDNPTNPHGTFIKEGSFFGMPSIWDAVYHSKVYISGEYKPLPNDILVGSYSKLLGINGLRTGWVATNNGLIYDHMYDLVTAEYCGLSSASTITLLQLLGNFDNSQWEDFETSARYKLDCNREEWAKLEKFFGGVPVSKNGMFYYSYMDFSCKILMEKANICWTSGLSLGANNDFGRFNIGQDCKLIRQAVKDILKIDRIK